MADIIYTQTLTQAGISEQAAKLYEILVKHGALPASSAARIAGISRTIAYHFLGELIDLGLVLRIEKKGKVITFEAAHPLTLKELGEKRIEQAKDAKTAIDGVVTKLISDFNIRSGKPGVQFFEGKEGVKNCLFDALDAKEEVRAYIDLKQVASSIPDISAEFTKLRARYKLRRKNLVADTTENRTLVLQYGHSDITEVRLFPMHEAPTHTLMQIYDNKVSYITLSDPMVGVLIVDPHIASMQKTLFDALWNDAHAKTETAFIDTANE